MIAIENLTKVFKTEEVDTYALNGISLSVSRGEYVSIMGPSGCGKSTLLNIIGLLDVPTRGRYAFEDVDCSELSESRRSALRKGEIGFVFQNFNLIDELTVAENIALPLVYLRVPKRERRQRTEQMLERLNILHRRNHFPNQLSGGQQQRTAVGRALVAGPRLILADEPTGNLDSANGAEVMALLDQARESDTTIIMVTHSMEYAGYADRIINLFDGSIVTQQKGRK